MNEPLFDQIGTDRCPRRRFWTGMPSSAEDATQAPAERGRKSVLAWPGIASWLPGFGGRRRPTPAG